MVGGYSSFSGFSLLTNELSRRANEDGTMISFFAIVAVVGGVWLLLESGAKYSSPAPSMYSTSGNGWMLIIIGVVGVLCVGFPS